jgi:DNA-directed RNA polymerase subunit K/omega
MLTKNIATIEEHEKLVGGRFQLAQIIMRRTKQLMNGSPAKEGLGEEFSAKRNGEIPNHRMPKVALEELRLGKLKWKNVAKGMPEKTIDDTIVFGE